MGNEGTYTVDKTVVGTVVVIVVHCVEVSVTKSAVFVNVLVTTLASGALFCKPPNLCFLSSTKLLLTSASFSTPLLNFAEFTFCNTVLRMVISILASGSGIQFGVGSTQEGVASTVVCVTCGAYAVLVTVNKSLVTTCTLSG